MLVAKLVSFANNSMSYFLSVYFCTNVHTTLLDTNALNELIAELSVIAKDGGTEA